MHESDTADRLVPLSRLRTADFEKAMVVVDVESAEESSAALGHRCKLASLAVSLAAES